MCVSQMFFYEDKAYNRINFTIIIQTFINESAY